MPGEWRPPDEGLVRETNYQFTDTEAESRSLDAAVRTPPGDATERDTSWRSADTTSESLSDTPDPAMTATPVSSTDEFEICGDPQPGQILFGKYQVITHLGKGGMGSVWLVRHLEFDTLRALKLIVSAIAGNSQARERFRREAKVMARISHPHAVIVHDARLTAQSVAFIEMEYIRGTSLDQLLKKGQPMPLDWVARILDQLCDVLETAHSQGIVHRDLKPSNLMLVGGRPAGQEYLKVLDFGIAKILQAEEADAGFQTQVGIAMGTPVYMSPEQTGGQVDGRSDLYTVGVILYQLLTGSLPFSGSLPALLIHHARSRPPTFQEINSAVEVPAAIERVVMRCLAKDPSERPQSARELVEDFRAALARHLPPTQTTQQRRAWLAPAIAVTLLFALGVAASKLAPTKPASPPDTTARHDNPAPPSTDPRSAAAALVPTVTGPASRPNPARTAASKATDPAGPITRDGRTYVRWTTGVYLPSGYRPADPADLVEGCWPRVLVREDDGIEFLRIPGGTFVMGGLERDLDADDANQPAHEVVLTGFYIQKYEVSNQEMRAFVTRSSELQVPDSPAEPWKRRFDEMKVRLGEEAALKHPATRIPWLVADQLAERQGAYLPTEAQWEYAARSGGKPTPVVWGKELDARVPTDRLTNMNFSSLNDFGTEEVGSPSYERDCTDQGVRDMIGNVRELCRDLHRPYAEMPRSWSDPVYPLDPGKPDSVLVVRGGSFKLYPEFRFTTHRGPGLRLADDVPADVGFRLVIECPDVPGPRGVDRPRSSPEPRP